MIEFMKIRAKAIKRAFDAKTSLNFQQLIGFNPPFIIGNERISLTVNKNLEKY